MAKHDQDDAQKHDLRNSFLEKLETVSNTREEQTYSTLETLRRKKRGKRNKKVKIEDYFDVIELDELDSDLEKDLESIEEGEDFQNIKETTFDREAQTKLSENEHKRFMPPSHQIGHALISKDKDGHLIAQQFKAPGTLDHEAPQIVPLKDIKLVEKFGAVHATAKTLSGQPMMSVRSVHIDTNYDEPKNQELFMFSPVTSHRWRGKPWWGGDESVVPPLFKENMDEDERKDLEKELKQIKARSKGSELKIKPLDIEKRDNMKRNPAQNKVMGGSAIDACEKFLDEYESELSEARKAVLQKSIQARPTTFGYKSHPRPEWLHVIGYGLTPLDIDPQVENNLGAAPKWVNTKMMVTERTLKWHAQNRPNSEQSLKVNFDMVLDSDLIEKGVIEGTIKEYERTVKIRQDLNPWVRNPQYTKPTDIAQTTLVSHHLLSNVEPLAVSDVKVEGKIKKQEPFLTGYKARLHSPELSTANSFFRKGSLSEEIDNRITKKKSRKKDALSYEVALNPTQHPFERSVVQIITTHQFEDYANPWKGEEPMESSGSGFMIERDGKYYIMTNAHVVENSKYLQVRLANEDKTYEAKALQVSYQADMALLEVSDSEFLAQVKPVTLGEMVSLRDKVSVVGFPMGGDELSTTKGIISRIEVQEYAESGESGLMAQTDSAINPGNSGGPVFDGDKVIGIAFQKITLADGLGYLIPAPVIQHFLDDYFSPGPYQGFPMLSFTFQPLTNPNFHKALQLDQEYTGVMITRIDPLTDPQAKIHEGDILHAIDGIKISNDGKAKVPGIGNRIDISYLFQRKFVGDQVKLTLIRENPENKKKELHEVDIELKWRPGQTKIISGHEYEKVPTYFVASGILFQPLTMNYLETSRGKALREMMVSKYGYLTEVPKKSLDQEIVIINRIFGSEYTKGYEIYENSVVKSINGIKINNIREALKAVEGNQSEFHRIVISSGEIIVVPNLSKEAHKALLNKYRVPKDRSADLKSSQSVDDENATKKESNLELNPEKQHSIESEMLLSRMQQLLDEDNLENSEGEEILSEDSLSSEGESDYELDDFVVEDDPKAWGKIPKELLFSDPVAATPGLARVQGVVDRMVNAFIEVDAENDSDDESFNLSIEESEEEAPKPRRRLRKKSQMR